MVLVLGIGKACLEILGIGIGVEKVVLLMSALKPLVKKAKATTSFSLTIFIKHGKILELSMFECPIV